MSASFVVLLPVILLGIVSLLCFVGCAFDTHGLAPAFQQYSSVTVLGNPDIVAFWPLLEANDSLPAADLTPNPDNGRYIDQNTLPGIYPWPAYTIIDPPDPDVLSAAAGGDNMSGTISFAQPGIVNGDYGINQTDSDTSAASPCLVVNGSYVNVPFAAKINPPDSFTVEAWVRVDWTANDPVAWRAVVDSRDVNPGTTGFAILAQVALDGSDNYFWRAVIGTGAAEFTAIIGTDPIKLNSASTPGGGTTYYLAITYDRPSQTLILYVDGLPSGSAVSNVAYVPNTTKPLWIGAADAFLTMRTPQTATGVLASPLFPFVGALQDVAIYKTALGPEAIQAHLFNGNGFNAPS
jgi:hypothetical protein